MLEDAGAWHTAELAFCFDNTKRCEQGTGNTQEAQALAKKMATARVNFARSGNPNQAGLTWTPSDPTRCQTMVSTIAVAWPTTRTQTAQDFAEPRCKSEPGKRPVRLPLPRARS
jgi:carboxylesterase type B